MKIAIAHDSLSEFGGAERVLTSLLRLFPFADVHTAFADDNIKRFILPRDFRGSVFTSWVQGTPLQHHTSLLQVFSPLLWRYDLTAYDLVITNSSFLMADCITTGRVPNIHFIQTPPKNIIGLEPPSRLQRIIPYGAFIRPWYLNSLKRSRDIITNSRHMQNVLLTHFGVRASVVYPPVTTSPHKPKRREKGSYFLMVGRIDRLKHIELAVTACTMLKLPLIVAGITNEPGYETYIRSIAGPTIRFIGFVSDKKRERLYTKAIAFLFPSLNEDFGIAPLEALSHGVPVIAYRGGGPAETLREGVTGHFFTRPTAENLAAVIRRFRPDRFDPSKLHDYAERFSETLFHEKITDIVRSVSGVS